MQKILITGYHGFIGSHLYRALPESYGLDIKNGSHEDIRICDLNREYTHIFHLAALRSAPMGEENPEDFISTNCWGTVRLLKRYPNARIINVTSASAKEPKGIYGATKKFAEIVGNFHPNLINLMPYNVFGEGQEYDSKAVIPHFINAALTDGVVNIYGDGTQRRDFTYVRDLVLEMIRLMFKINLKGIVHAGYSKSISINELLKKIMDLVPYQNYKINYLPKRGFDIETSIAPYGIKEHFGRDEGLKKTIEWWRKEKNLVAERLFDR